jgi:tetratricopeptide (TPR) repeat protein
MTPDADETTIALRRASALCAMRRYPDAVRAAGAILSGDPRNADAWCLMAVAQLGQERYEAALQAARAASSATPHAEWPQRLASAALTRLGRFGESAQAAGEAVRLDPHSWRAHTSLAHALASVKGRGPDAFAAAGRATELAPDRAETHTAAGVVAMSYGARDEADQAFRRALAIDPQSTAAQNGLGALKLRRRSSSSLAEAATIFANTAAADPRNKASRHNLDVTIVRFMALTAYLVLLDAYLLIALTDRAGQLVGRLATVVLLAIPAVYSVRFLAKLPEHLRRYVAQTLLRRGTLKTAGALEAVAVGALIGAAITSHNARPALALAAIVSALGARLLIFAARNQAARETASPRSIKVGNRNLSKLAAVLGIGALLALYDTFNSHQKLVSTIWTIGLGLACALVIRSRRRSSP